MRLRCRHWEKKLRKRIKREIRKSKALRAEWRRVRKSYPRRFKGNFIVGLIPLAVVCSVSQAVQNIELFLLGLALLVTGLAVLSLSQFLSDLCWSQGVYVVAHLPVSDSDFFKLQCRRRLLKTLWIPYVVAIVYVLVGLRCDFSVEQWTLACLLCLLQWLAMVAAAFLLARWLPQAPYAPIGVALCILAIVAFTFSTFTTARVDRMWPWLFLSPSGWCNFAFREGIIGGNTASLLIAMPAFLFFPFFRRQYDYLESVYELGHIMFGVLPTAELVRECLVEERGREGRTRERITRDLLFGRAWTKDSVIERIVRRVLSHREKRILDFMTQGKPKWTSLWVIGSAIAVAGGLAGGLSENLQWLICPAAIVGAVFPLPLFGGSWPGLGMVQWGTLFGPLNICYPIGYWEMGWLFFKVNLARILLWLPVALGTAGFAGWKFSGRPAVGVLSGGFIIYMLVAVQVFMLGIRIYGSSSAASRVKWQSLIAAPFMLISLLGIVLGGYLLSTGCTLTLRMTGASLIIVPAAIMWCVEGVIYNRARIDLIREFP